ncbi:MAG: thiamine diphosphokinase [Clostridiaceae bacterium]|nr:thiamine diphosphokinase [Clostridiaceae bacterium]
MATFERAVIFANGDIIADYPLELSEKDFLIAADGGAAHILRRGLTPHLLMGDLDSISRSDLAFCEAENVEILSFPKDKDETDLELALKEALDRGFQEIVLTAVFGDLPDHTLGNLALLGMPEIGSARLFISDGGRHVFYVKDEITLDAQVGDRVSLLPWNGIAAGIRTEGLRYALQNETLYPWKSRGISNVVERSPFRVLLDEGALMLFHFTKPSAYGIDHYD